MNDDRAKHYPVIWDRFSLNFEAGGPYFTFWADFRHDTDKGAPAAQFGNLKYEDVVKIRDQANQAIAQYVEHLRDPQKWHRELLAMNQEQMEET